MKMPLLVAVLLAHANLLSQCYSVSAIPYEQDTSASVQDSVQLADDQWSQIISIGFPFCFYGEQYDSLLIGTNGILTFEIDSANGGCQWYIGPHLLPSPNFPVNSIMLPWADLNPFKMGVICYWTSGLAPNRTFNVRYDTVPMYNGPVYSSRVTLHESSNKIEIQLESKPFCGWNQNHAIIGLQNQFGTSGVAVPGRTTPLGWSASQEGWLFSPDCDVCQGVGVDENEKVNDFSVFPNPSNGNFTLQFENANTTIAVYDVIDISGRVVLSAQVNAQKAHFTLENSGMYFVRAFDESGSLIATEKLIVQ